MQPDSNMKIGIWTLDLSTANLLRLANKGFNKIFLQTGYFWNIVKDDPYYPTVIDKQKRTAEEMFKCYKIAKQLGFKYFLIDFSWGLGEVDNNYFYKHIYDKFEKCDNVIYYSGEPIENYVETGQYSYAVMKQILSAKYNLAKGNILFYATARNFDKLKELYPKNTTLSSYCNVEKYWAKGVPTVWFMGDPSISLFGGAYNYESRINFAKKIGIDDFILYQGNDSGITAVGWEKFLVKIFYGINKFNASMQDKFLKLFN